MKSVSYTSLPTKFVLYFIPLLLLAVLYERLLTGQDLFKTISAVAVEVPPCNGSLRGQQFSETSLQAEKHYNASLGSEDWLVKCQHHLCTPHHQPASYYTCDLRDRQWSLTFLQKGYWPSNSGPEIEKNFATSFGHQGWAGSIVRGLQDLGSEAGIWNYQPSHETMLNDIIWTDDCPRARQAVSSGKLRTKMIICGAVGSTFQDLGEFHDFNVGFHIAPSQWVADEMRMDKRLAGSEIRIRVLVTGVNTSFWAPTVPPEKKSKQVVFYLKFSGGSGFTHESPLFKLAHKALVNNGWNVDVVSYGSYNADTWKFFLNKSVAAIFMINTESQSIAQAEAWAMDVPTYVHDVNPNHPLNFFDRWWWFANEAPYLNYMNGARWSDVHGLLNLLNTRYTKVLRPREYVLNTMTDSIAVKNSLRAMHCEWKRRFPLSQVVGKGFGNYNHTE